MVTEEAASPEWTAFLLLNSTRNQNFGTSSGHWRHPPPPGVQMSLGKSLLALESPILVESLSLIWKWGRLPAPSQVERYWGGAGEISGTDPLTV